MEYMPKFRQGFFGLSDFCDIYEGLCTISPFLEELRKRKLFLGRSLFIHTTLNSSKMKGKAHIVENHKSSKSFLSVNFGLFHLLDLNFELFHFLSI